MNLAAMTIADYEDAIALWQGCDGIGLSAADSREAIARYLARNPGMSFVAREADGRLVGAVLCGHDGRRGYLHHLAVAPGSRKHGLGRALVERCMDALLREGIDRCHLFVFRDNTPGQAFWLSTGWNERKTLVILSRDIEPGAAH